MFSIATVTERIASIVISPARFGTPHDASKSHARGGTPRTSGKAWQLTSFRRETRIFVSVAASRCLVVGTQVRLGKRWSVR